MSKHFACCEQCFKYIGQQSTNAAGLWLELCNLRLYHGENITLYLEDFPEMRTLELLGFVVSTDRDTNMGVKIKGYCLSEDGSDFFCVRGGCHV